MPKNPEINSSEVTAQPENFSAIYTGPLRSSSQNKPSRLGVYGLGYLLQSQVYSDGSYKSDLAGTLRTPRRAVHFSAVSRSHVLGKVRSSPRYCLGDSGGAWFYKDGVALVTSQWATFSERDFRSMNPGDSFQLPRLKAKMKWTEQQVPSRARVHGVHRCRKVNNLRKCWN